MKEPSGELVELDFYFGSRDRVDLFRQVVKHCCENGGKFAGQILASEGPGIRQRRFTSIYSDPVRVVNVTTAELQAKFADTNTDIMKVAVWSAIGVSNDVPEIITYSGVSTEVSEKDNPAIAIVGEGWVFSTPGQERSRKKAGKRCYQRFLEICADLDPDYAAILNEDSLPCRYDLRRGNGDRCFTDFFVSKTVYGGQMIATIEKLYCDAYIETLNTGLFISTYPMYNPRHIGVEPEASIARSTKIARMLSIQ